MLHYATQKVDIMMYKKERLQLRQFIGIYRIIPSYRNPKTLSYSDRD